MNFILGSVPNKNKFSYPDIPFQRQLYSLVDRERRNSVLFFFPHLMIRIKTVLYFLLKNPYTNGLTLLLIIISNIVIGCKYDMYESVTILKVHNIESM